MGKYNRRSKFKKVEKKEKVKVDIKMSEDIDENITKLKEILKDCDDIIYRDFLVGEKQDYKVAIIYVDGLTDKELISNFAMESLMHEARELKPNPRGIKKSLFELINKGNIAVTEVKELKSLEEVVDTLLIGETVLLLDGYDKALLLSSRGWPIRGLQEPQTETVVRGPRDGFVETGKVNTTLIRRRIRDPKLKLKYMQIGERSKTDIAIMYIEDIVGEKILKEVKRRLENITIDAILESSIIEQFIEDDWLSPFPQAESTERPDSVASALYEGRVAIVVDNTPFVLLVPATINTLLQSSEDYYQRWIVGSFMRIVRYVSLPLSLLLPSLYIAMTSYHPGMLPTKLALYIGATRQGVPFPAFIEAFIMEATLEILREAGTRLSGPIGTTIGIVGGLVIGQAAVEAGIVSPLMVIIVALTTVSAFAIPSYSLSSGFRIVRFLLMVTSAVLGLYGIVLGLLILLTHLANLRSFGVPYLSPYGTLGEDNTDLKDSMIRLPFLSMKRRPRFTKKNNKNRMDE